tara:strand:- start:160 stop:441 length:282 start_codon:yes stop_codon:yes gene_type:complete
MDRDKILKVCEDANGNYCITPNALLMLLASQRQDVVRKTMRKEEVIYTLALKNERQLSSLLKDPYCKLEKGLIPNTFKIASVKLEQDRHTFFR